MSAHVGSAYAGSNNYGGYTGPLHNPTLVSYPNGAVVPADTPSVAAARADHLAHAGHGNVGHAHGGYGNVGHAGLAHGVQGHGGHAYGGQVHGGYVDYDNGIEGAYDYEFDNHH